MPKLRLLPVLGSVYLSPLDQLFSFLSSALSSSILCSTLNFDRDVVLRTTRPLQRVIPTVTAIDLRSFPVTSKPSIYRLNGRSGQSRFLGCCPPILHPHFLVISFGPSRYTLSSRSKLPNPLGRLDIWRWLAMSSVLLILFRSGRGCTSTS